MWLKIGETRLLNTDRVSSFLEQDYGTDGYCVKAIYDNDTEIIIFNDKSEEKCKSVIDGIYKAIANNVSCIDLNAMKHGSRS